MIVIHDRITNTIQVTEYKSAAARIIGVTNQTITNWSKQDIYLYNRWEIHFNAEYVKPKFKQYLTNEKK